MDEEAEAEEQAREEEEQDGLLDLLSAQYEDAGAKKKGKGKK